MSALKLRPTKQDPQDRTDKTVGFSSACLGGGICLLPCPKLLLDGRNAVNLSRLALLLRIAATLAFTANFAAAQTPPPAKKPAPNAPATAAMPNAPQSTHYPILLLAFGNAPTWDVRIGPKGPELLERQGYPPIVLDPTEISREGTAESWIYRAKDYAAGATFSVRLTREACSDSTSTTKYTFRAVVTH